MKLINQALDTKVFKVSGKQDGQDVVFNIVADSEQQALDVLVAFRDTAVSDVKVEEVSDAVVGSGGVINALKKKIAGKNYFDQIAYGVFPDREMYTSKFTEEDVHRHIGYMTSAMIASCPHIVEDSDEHDTHMAVDLLCAAFENVFATFMMASKEWDGEPLSSDQVWAFINYVAKQQNESPEEDDSDEE